MDMPNFLQMFPGIATLVEQLSSPPTFATAIARIALILLGILLVYLGKKGTLEPLLMIPMGMGMIAVNAGVLVLDPQTTRHVVENADATTRVHGTLFLAPLVQRTDDLMYILQVDFLQPVYTYMFSNGLIACLVFLGIGSLLDVGYLLARPFESMFLAICGELGTFLVFPIAVALGLSYGEAASIAMVGGADGPMVMYTTLLLSHDLFVPITVVAYLYLGLTHGGYPYLIKALIPKHIRVVRTAKPARSSDVSAGEKLAFSVVACAALCLLFPVAAPLFMCLFLGVAVREAGIAPFVNLLNNTMLYSATFFLGLVLGVLCEGSTLLNPVVLKLLLLGILALLLSGIGGIFGGYVLYWLKGRAYNPIIGIAAVSCVPTTAKVAQKLVQEEAPGEIILPQALGANISGVITSAVICAIYVTLIPLIQ